MQIVELLEPSSSLGYFQQIAQHYASTRDYPLAEEYYLKVKGWDGRDTVGCSRQSYAVEPLLKTTPEIRTPLY